MPCRNDYIRMVRLSIQRSLKEDFSFRANDFEIGISKKEKLPDEPNYLAIFDINELIKGIQKGSLYNCLDISQKHRLNKFIKNGGKKC